MQFSNPNKYHAHFASNYIISSKERKNDIFDPRNEILGELADSGYVLAGRQLGGGILLTMLSYWKCGERISA